MVPYGVVSISYMWNSVAHHVLNGLETPLRWQNLQKGWKMLNKKFDSSVHSELWLRWASAME